jgi:glycosyltransferase involved in cell wall biosynthesis
MSRSIAYLLERRLPGETFIAREMDALHRQGWSVQVYALDALDPRGANGPAAHRAVQTLLRRAGVELLHNPLLAARLLRHLPQARALASRLAASGACHLHAHFAWLPADVAGAAATACGIPWSCSVHAWDIFTRSPAETGRRLRGAAGIAACTEAAVQAALAAGVPAARIHLIRHGLPRLPAEQPAVSPMPDSLLAVGRLVPKKGFDTLVAACRLLTARHVAFTCRIVGDGPERAALKRAIRAAGLGARVCVEPALPPDRVLARIAAATLLVLPSRRLRNDDRDGFANVLTEAMAAGTPVVTTTAGAAGELVVDGRNGRLVPPDDPVALADALAVLLADAPARARLAAAARRTVAEKLDEQTEISKLIAMIGAA